MLNIKGLAFFDLDGTLLNEHSEVSPEVAEAMNQLRQNNIFPVIATGRTNIEVERIAKETGINSLITMNGQYVQFEDKEVFSSIIPAEDAIRLKEVAKSIGQEVAFYNHKNITVSAHTPMVEKCYGFIHSDMPPINDRLYETEVLNMLLVVGEDQDKTYHDALPDLTFFRNGPFSIDVVAKGGSKGTGVAELTKALGLVDIPTYGFGDGMNDLDLLKACDHKIAMGNAKDPLKEIATYISAKNTEGGIIQALKHFELI